MLDTKTDGDHSVLAPSSASKWFSCPAAVRLSMGISDDRTNEAAQLGTFVHLLGENLLRGEPVEVGRSITDDRSKKMTYTSKKMYDDAHFYANYVKSFMTPTSELTVEKSIEIFPEFDVSGHADAVIVHEEELHIFDYKNGRIHVDPDENPQLMLYAVGVYEEESMYYDFKTIHIHIIQPNSVEGGHSSEWVCTVDDLEDFRDYAHSKAEAALQEDSIPVPSEKACQWCLAASTCPALLKETTKLFDDLEDVAEKGDLPSLDLITRILTKRKMFDTAIKAYEARVYDSLSNGTQVPGFKLVQKRTNKKWLDQIDAMQKIKNWLPIDEVAPRKLITPTQTEKLLGKISTKKANIFNSLWERPDGTLIVAPESDRREAFDLAGDFDDISGD